MTSYSNAVNVPWTVPTGGGGGTFVPQGWIGSPLIGAVVQGQVPITVASGITLTSGVLEYWPTSNPSAVTVLNSNTTGTGTIGTFDGTLLPSGGYTIQLTATSSTGATQISLTAVTVTGEYKPGRERVTVTDFKVPLAGIPISISRTYDSLARSTVSDFGNGWSLAVGVNLTVDAFDNVTFNFNNQAVTFNFVPQAQNGLFPWSRLLSRAALIYFCNALWAGVPRHRFLALGALGDRQASSQERYIICSVRWKGASYVAVNPL